jgi:hypothetical protein
MDTPKEFAEDWVDTIKDAHRHYKPPIWYKQPKYVEVWIEKQAMYSTFESILSDKQVVVQSGRGFNSLTALYKASRRHWKIRRDQNREIVILYFGDLDLSGDSMDDYIRRRLKAFGLYNLVETDRSEARTCAGILLARRSRRGYCRAIEEELF